MYKDRYLDQDDVVCPKCKIMTFPVKDISDGHTGYFECECGQKIKVEIERPIWVNIFTPMERKVAEVALANSEGKEGEEDEDKTVMEKLRDGEINEDDPTEDR